MNETDEWAGDERTARMVLATVCEPGDELTGSMLELVGAGGAVAVAGGGALPGGLDRASGQLWARRAAERLNPDRVRQVIDETARHRFEVLIPGDPRWPATGLDALGRRAPIALWAQGDAELLSAPTVRRVTLTGSRAATSYGEHVVIELAGDAARDGRQVVTGGAYGIDIAAHTGSLAAGGPSIAVLAGGLDRPYPAGNQELLARIGQTGLLISEAPPGVLPTRGRFEQRARLLAGLSGAVVVVEAAFRSGALRTAEQAIRLGRGLGAVPGPVTSAASAGCHRLLQERHAGLVTDWQDVRSLLDPAQAPSASGPGPAAQRSAAARRPTASGHDRPTGPTL